MNFNTYKTLQSPPNHFSSEKFFAGIHWHQKWEVFQGVSTPGLKPGISDTRVAQLPLDLSGKRV